MPSGAGASAIWKEAMAQGKRHGYTDFRKGTRGGEFVRRVAEAIAADKNRKS